MVLRRFRGSCPRLSGGFSGTDLTFPRVMVSSRVRVTSRVREISRVGVFAGVGVTSRVGVMVRVTSRIKVTSKIKVRVRVRDSYHPYGGLGACPRVRVRSKIRVRATRGDGRARGPRGCGRVFSSRSVRHLPAALAARDKGLRVDFRTLVFFRLLPAALAARVLCLIGASVTDRTLSRPSLR